MYILAAPIILVGIIGIIIWNLILHIKHIGGLSVKDILGAIFEGFSEGHTINMAKIDYVCHKDEVFKEEIL